MNTRDDNDTLIDLGAASAETQGQPGFQMDFGIAGRPIGISDED